MIVKVSFEENYARQVWQIRTVMALSNSYNIELGVQYKIALLRVTTFDSLLQLESGSSHIAIYQSY